MLNYIRNTQNNIFIKFILILIALSFLGFGGSRYFNQSSEVMVDFNNAQIENVTKGEFTRLRYNKINQLQGKSGYVFSKEELKQLNIDHMVLNELISNRIMSYLSYYYDVNVSEDKAIEFIQTLPMFQNQNKQFDPDIFNHTFGSNARKQEYIENIQKSLNNSIILNIFQDNANYPKIAKDNIINHLSESKLVDIIYLDLDKYAVKDKIINDEINNKLEDEKLLQEFYQNHKDQFIISQKRAFEYLVINKNYLKNKITINDDEAKDYYLTHKDDFNNQTFKQAKKEIINILVDQKIEDKYALLLEEIEDDIDMGKDLDYIATKFNIKIQKQDLINFKELSKSQNNDLFLTADYIFNDLDILETSKPIEVKNNYSVIITRLTNIQEDKQLSFEESKNLVIAEMKKYLYQQAAKRQFTDLHKNYDPLINNNDKKQLQLSGFKFLSNQSYIRNSLNNIDLPNKILHYIFITKNQHKTPVIINDNKIYFAYVKKSKINKREKQKLQNNSLNQMNLSLKSIILQEILAYFGQNIKIYK